MSRGMGMVRQIQPAMKGAAMEIMVHLRPILAIMMPVAKLETRAPMGKMAPIQLPTSLPKSSSKAQLSPHSARTGRAGEVHERPRPRPKAPKVAGKNRTKVFTEYFQEIFGSFPKGGSPRILVGLFAEFKPV